MRIRPRTSNRTRSRTSRGLAAVLAAGLLAGCALLDDGPPAAAPDGGGGDGGPVTLTVGVFGVFGFEEAGLYDEYEKLYPDVTIVEKAAPSNEEYYPALRDALDSGRGLADIQAVEVGNISEVVATRADRLMDLGTATGVDEGAFLPWKWDQATTDENKTVGLGTDIGPMAVCYRKDLFRAAGLPTDREEVAALWFSDWEKYLGVGADYMANAPAGTAFVDSAAGVYNGSISSFPVRYFGREGEVIYQDSPAVEVSWDLAMQAAQGDMTARLKQFTPAWDEGFAEGGFATVICPSWMLGYIQEKAGPGAADKWDIATAPKPANWGGSFLTVPEAGEHREAAARLAAWLTAPEQQARLFEKRASFPSSQAAYELPQVADATHPYFNDAPTGEIFSIAAKSIPTLELGAKDQPIQQQITDAGILPVEQGKLTPAQAWRAAERKIDALLNR
ncbi:sugar-binding protein [Streptomyces sp. WAC 06738]|uniref:ABC transporter substrate-binding protein n=1 Tax=Streptomyces sp. WAC 06738 TaxID=2203210 RepID=UPI000F6E2E76|nr:extracellular solute-binding protein [Streptomyces sp. WAC 06738]AZM49911.1 sugar-binding protein [Streptomyces sp. WAC 06738]